MILSIFATIIGLVSSHISLSSLTKGVNNIFDRATIAGGTKLRIQPLGDSITHGFQSSDNNGYRLQLSNDLSGSNIKFIGSNPSGTMPDNYNEGHNSATIRQIAQFATYSLPERPNIVLLHAGTNDLLSDTPADPYDSAPERLGDLLDEIISACPDATILVAKIIHNDNPEVARRIAAFNSQIPGLVSARISAGHKNIAAVDFTSIGATEDLADHIHPTDATYRKMGDIWFSAIEDAANKGWIKDPVGPDPPDEGTGSVGGAQECLSGLFLYQPDGGQLEASGVGHNGDHKFTNNWGTPVQIATGFGWNYTGIRLADLDGDGKLVQFQPPRNLLVYSTSLSPQTKSAPGIDVSKADLWVY